MDAYKYKGTSFVLDKLLESADADRGWLLVRYGTDTLEYDLATTNANTPILITDACTHAELLREGLEAPFGHFESVTFLIRDNLNGFLALGIDRDLLLAVDRDNRTDSFRLVVFQHDGPDRGVHLQDNPGE